MSQSRPHLVAVVGPTAVGKTELGIALAKALGGEIISADSRQIYKYMDIGTAKPTLRERQEAPHHLLDVVKPDQTLTLAEYRVMAQQAIEDVWSRGRLPLLVGGTGLYVTALLEGWLPPRVPPDTALRERLFHEAEANGPQALHARLAEVDPISAAQIDQRNVRRVVRALEVYLKTGVAASSQRTRQPPAYAVLKIGLTMERSLLYARADERVDRMIERGFVEEVEMLVRRGYDYDLPAMSALGYRQLGQYLRGEISLPEAIALIKRHTRRFIRHQYAWFRPDDQTINWFDTTQCRPEDVVTLVGDFLDKGATDKRE